MPRGGGGRSRSPLSRGSSPGFRNRSYSTPPTPKPPTPPPQPQHPSMMRQMAATAGGVAAGSLIAGAFMGGGRDRDESGRTEDDRRQEQVQEEDPCAQELRNLITCFEMAQESGSDLKMCAGIEKKLIDCRQKYGPRK